jgi:hypothetical protein
VWGSESRTKRTLSPPPLSPASGERGICVIALVGLEPLSPASGERVWMAGPRVSMVPLSPALGEKGFQNRL